ncbi:MAG: radical SAM protein [Gammaproteobacteria bacterium]|nr:MAG: radical SAM protein [Gammaproteobacteria bacterium]
MKANANNAIQLAPDDELRTIFITSLRQRFKSEINRLTRGDMARSLGDRPDVAQLSFLMSYVYIWHWLQHNVDKSYQPEVLAAFSKGPQAFLIELLRTSHTASDFVKAYINYWQLYAGEPQLQQHNLFHLLQQTKGDSEKLTSYILDIWQSLHFFTRSYAIAYRDLAQEEKERYRDMLGPEDKQRLALIDALPDTNVEIRSFPKLGLIPHMGCPQTCRHCMFIFRPLMNDTPPPDDLYTQVNALTDSVLFTGGDLSKHLDHFYHAIESMPNIRTFAILLNGDFADDRDMTRSVLENMARAIRRRSVQWPKAKVMLQISFDEFHQEVYLDKKGNLRERIPVAKIANIVEAAPKYGDEIQLCLLHKQHALNFSMDLFRKGVFARLANELGRRGHQLQVLSAAPSSRLKRNPQNPDAPAQIIRDANFVLTDYPDAPIILTSSTIDAYGRASMMDESETVKEKDLLNEVLTNGPPPCEYFDTDIMFWFNGWATLFSAVHMCLGNVQEEGMDTILKRQQKDPLCKALHDFDKRLLDYYAEIRNDLDSRIEAATGPHQLFHSLTEDAEMRLHMTRRLLAAG